MANNNNKNVRNMSCKYLLAKTSGEHRLHMAYILANNANVYCAKLRHLQKKKKKLVHWYYGCWYCLHYWMLANWSKRNLLAVGLNVHQPTTDTEQDTVMWNVFSVEVYRKLQMFLHSKVSDNLGIFYKHFYTWLKSK